MDKITYKLDGVLYELNRVPSGESGIWFAQVADDQVMAAFRISFAEALSLVRWLRSQHAWRNPPALTERRMEALAERNEEIAMSEMKRFAERFTETGEITPEVAQRGQRALEALDHRVIVDEVLLKAAFSAATRAINALPANRDALHKRLERALDIVRAGDVERHDGVWTVRSQTGGPAYTFMLNGDCQCLDAVGEEARAPVWNGHKCCKHKLAVLLVHKAEGLDIRPPKNPGNRHARVAWFGSTIGARTVTEAEVPEIAARAEGKGFTVIKLPAVPKRGQKLAARWGNNILILGPDSPETRGVLPRIAAAFGKLGIPVQFPVLA